MKKSPKNLNKLLLEPLAPVAITCSRYCAKIPDFVSSKKIIEYSPRKPKNKRLSSCLLSTDGKRVFDGFKYYNVDDYDFCSNHEQDGVIVLTSKEKQLLLSWSLKTEQKLIALEEAYPIFSDIKFSNNLEGSYYRLKRAIDYIKTLGFKSESLASELSSYHKKLIKKKNSIKTSLDEYFHFAYLPPFQEVFKFKETRKNRSVIALDFNSMFASCLEGKFVKPSDVKFKLVEQLYENQTLDEGIYLVVLKKPIVSWFRNYHPFKFSMFNRHFTFNLEDNHELKMYLFKNELEYYRKFFEEVFIIYGVTSFKSVGHPLYNQSKKLYKKRRSAKKNRKKVLEKLYKLKLAMLHSATNPLSYIKKEFINEDELLQFLSNQYGFLLEESGSLEMVSHPKYFQIRQLESAFQLKAIDTNNKGSILSFSSQVLATSRLKVCQLLERLNSFESADICYINTDSVHISIDSNLLQRFYESFSDVLSDELGCVKIQTLADSGYWFDVGRYFLIKADEIVQFKNTMLNHNGNEKPFIEKRKIKHRFVTDNFSHIVEVNKSLVSTLSYNKKLIIPVSEETNDVVYSRYNYDDISDVNKQVLTTRNEELNSQKYKLDTYFELKNCFE